jgi:hypothetical protein
MTAPGNREALSLSCLCCAMAGAFCGVVVCLVGGLMARRVQDWQKSHQGLGAGIYCLHACMDARMPTPRCGHVVQQEGKYGWYLHACVTRRRSTGEDWRDRESTCMCMHCLCVWIEILHSYICVCDWLNQRNQPK